MRRAIAMLLFVLLVLGAGVVPAAAAESDDPYGVTRALYGDVNLDRKIDAADALAILKAAVAKTVLNELQAVVANVNADNSINAVDALLVLQFAVHKLTELPAGVLYEIKPQSNDPIVRFDKTNSVNGAYVPDLTADTSFHADLSSLPAHTLYRIGLNAISGDKDKARLLYSLQGLVNRDFGMDDDHTVLMYVVGDGSDADWLKVITEEGTIAAELTPVTITKWDDFMATFGDVIRACGIIAWDGNVPATANVAATICGLDGYLPVLYGCPLHSELVAANVPVKQSLSGVFRNGRKGQAINGTSLTSTGSAKNDAYLWALEKYFPRCSSTYLAYTLDGAICIKDYGDLYADNPIAVAGGNNCLTNMDYFIARRCFVYDLAVYKGDAACDDPAQQNGQASVGEDNRTMLKIFAARFKRANGAFGQLLGFPPWWAKYTAFHDMGSKGEVWNEWLFAEYITCYNMAKEADAQAPASMTNGSVYYKYVPHTKQYTNNHNKQDLAFNSNVFYYTFYVGDYDSSAWMKQHVHTMWLKNGGDRRRGALPLMWSFNPNLSYRVPMIFDYVYEHRTDNDYFAAGDGGAGYVMPSALVQGTVMPNMGEARPVENGEAGNLWAAYSKPFYDRFDLDITGFIINSGISAMPANVASFMNKISPVGSFMNSSGTRLGLYNGTPYIHCYNQITTGQSAAMYSYATNTMRGYNFGAYRTICQTPTQMYTIVNDFNAYAAGKGLTTQFLDPYTYFALVRKSGQGTQIR